jgi:TPR repeat protein
MYEIGDGIKKDIDQAVYWYKKSAAQGHQNSNL